MSAERCWAHAMELKKELEQKVEQKQKLEPRKRNHMIR
jgi:hypothetical protein